MPPRFLLVLLAIVSTQLAALLIFTRGFFLTRIELPNQSDCSKAPVLHAAPQAPQPCWTTPQFKRAIVVVIDALRIDFTEFTDHEALHPFENKLKVIRDLLFDRPENAILLPFVADPPTTTMQRLKGITTGGLPTFIELKDDLAGEAVTEDNLLLQMKKYGKRSTFMGDDTWVSLFPDAFNRSFPYPSFNVKDLHTVDNGVIEHLIPEMQTPDWDLVIAHFLGVDHVGHRFGPDHHEMASKLSQMNMVIESVVKAMDHDAMDDTILLVFGDHGMTADGNHGGATEEEVTAALFAYSPKSKFLSGTPRSVDEPLLQDIARRMEHDHILLHDHQVSVREINDTAADAHLEALPNVKRSIFQRKPPVNQVDLTPTLALLLGLPIPFGNLGRVIPEFFFVDTAGQGAKQGAQSEKEGAQGVEEGVQGVEEGAQPHYSNQQDLYFLRRFQTLNTAMERNVGQVLGYLKAYAAHVGDGKSVGVDLLDQLEATASAIYKKLGQLPSLPLQDGEHTTVDLLEIHKEAFDVGQRVLDRAAQQGRELWTQFDLPMMFAGIALLGVSMCVCVYLSVREVGVREDLLPALGLFLLQVLGLFSNSYIVAEGRVFLFLGSSAVVCFLRSLLVCGRAHQPTRREAQALGVAVLLLVTGRVGVVQGDAQWQQGLEAFSTANSLFSVQFSLVPCLLVAVAPLWVVLRQPKYSPWMVVSALIPVSQSLVVCGYWTVQSRVGGEHGSDQIPDILRLGLPRVVYALGVLSMVTWPWAATVARSSNEDASSFRHPVLVAGILVTLPWVFPFMLVVGPASPLVCWMMLLHIAGMVYLAGHATGNTELLLMVFVWVNSTGVFFHGTGHEPTFNKLHYASPFVGFDEYEWYRCGVMLAFNTFGVHLLHLWALPAVGVVGGLEENVVDGVRKTRDAVARDTSDAVRGSSSNPAHKPVRARVHLAFLLAMTYFAVKTFATTAFVAAQRRHLMVWAIFAPKFVFDAATLMVVGVVSLCVCARW